MHDRRVFRFAWHGLVLTVAALMLFAARPADARTDPDDTLLTSGSVESTTGGTYVHAELYERSDGAFYARVWVLDNAPDGLCAHASVSWFGDGVDYGMWHCGYGTGEWFTTPVHDPANFGEIWIAAFQDDNRDGAALPIWG